VYKIGINYKNQLLFSSETHPIKIVILMRMGCYLISLIRHYKFVNLEVKATKFKIPYLPSFMDLNFNFKRNLNHLEELIPFIFNYSF
jgi:hypothetical protein